MFAQFIETAQVNDIQLGNQGMINIDDDMKLDFWI